MTKTDPKEATKHSDTATKESPHNKNPVKRTPETKKKQYFYPISE